jgi:hypothetical protein
LKEDGALRTGADVLGVKPQIVITYSSLLQRQKALAPTSRTHNFVNFNEVLQEIENNKTVRLCIFKGFMMFLEHLLQGMRVHVVFMVALEDHMQVVQVLHVFDPCVYICID